MEFRSYNAFADHLLAVAAALQKELDHAMEETGAFAVNLAKSKIGDYQPEYVTPQGRFFPAWALLSPNTLNGGVTENGFRYLGKIELGYSPPDNPLLREGTLRDSIEFSRERGYAVEMLTLGSNDQIMLYQEVGTRKIPPRSVIGESMAETVQAFFLPRALVAIERAFRA